MSIPLKKKLCMTNKTFTHGSLFSGIGGFDLSAEWMGWENAFHCENNPFGQKVLKYYWPKAISYGDITKTDFTIHRGTIDILTGGFPCQPYSLAGKRKGKEDSRHLWPEMLRAIREIKPVWIVGENVPGIINWNRGMVFNEVQTDLEAEGYEVQPVLLPAVCVNSIQKRERIFFIAYNYSARCERDKKSEKRQQRTAFNEFNSCFGARDITNDNSTGLSERLQSRIISDAEKKNTYQGSKLTRIYTKDYWQEFPITSPFWSRNDGVSYKSHRDTFYETNDMDRDYIIKNAIDEGKIQVDFVTGAIYSTQIRGHEGKIIELPGAECNGYRVHNISFNGIKKSCRAHQIVWIAKNGLYDRAKYVIDHINRNKSDNRIDNLRLATASENRRNCDDYTGQFTEDQKKEIAALYHNSDMSMRELADNIGISKSRIGQIVQEQKLLDGITFSKWRNESIKAFGNAIVPQVAFEIFKAIQEYDPSQKETLQRNK